jgi:hypoxanthine-DNA glycosylase
MPSPASRAHYYYGHPQNRFWQTMAELFDAPKPETREEKREFILERHLALWDVLHSCEIVGAEDSTIQNPVPNQFKPLLARTRIQAIFTNGQKATKMFNQMCAQEALMQATGLPSTSPANRAQQGKPLFLEKWRQILNFL